MFLSRTNSVYGALHSALLLMITTPAQNGKRYTPWKLVSSRMCDRADW